MPGILLVSGIFAHPRHSDGFYPYLSLLSRSPGVTRVSSQIFECQVTCYMDQSLES